MKHYLYHRVPENMFGNILYPLNQLKEINFDLYKEQNKKYIGREFVTEQIIPDLNCLWNDVLHFSAVHPQNIVDEFSKNNKTLKAQRFFKIDPNILDKDKTIVCLFGEENNSKKWTDFNLLDIEKYNFLPEKTKKYYKDQFSKKEGPLLWAFVPHILYKGSLDILNCEIFEI